MALSTNDPTSFSNSEQVVVTHIDLDLDVNFEQKILAGHVNLHVKRVKDGTDKLLLDTRQMTILSVKDSNGGELTYSLGENVGPFGAKLEINLPNSKDQRNVICVQYKTDPTIEALQWLSPQQTAGKKKPYLFSQCEAIHCRSIIPIQDTPAVKFTYTAKITAPEGIQMLMSALYKGCVKCPTDPNKVVHSFQQDICIPSYLIAIAGGDIVSREIGPRSKVWTEPPFLDSCAHEFAETEAMLQKAEELLGPYVWGQYDLLVLPPSFPYGGMENPCLTFVTPTLLAGDRSLADVVAHEIAHSWTGNLVTNKTFEHFWLNEGNTVFVERKIVSALKDSEVYRQYLGFYGWEELQETVNNLMKSTSQYTRLVINMEGIDPDESFSKVPYEKGCAFLFYLESELGGPDVFNPFMKAYIERYKYQSVTTEDWKSFLYEYFQDKRQILDRVDWNAWFNGEGMPQPQNKPKYDESMVVSVQKLVDRWVTATDDQLDQFTHTDVENFVTKQTEQFLHFILDKDPLSRPKIVKMGDVYKYKDTQNSEIKKRWIEVCIKAQYEEIIPSALQFVSEQGRMKFVIPVYRALFGWERSRQESIDNFEANKDAMHGITATKVKKLMEE